jgi:hypothetical protein
MPIDIKNPGGTPGGMREFLLGLILLVLGGFMLFNQVQVHGGYWNFGWAGSYGASFGITLLPLLFGIGLLFFNGKSAAGAILTFGGLLVILAGIIVNLDIHFRQTSLWNTLTMLISIVAGIGLIAKGVLPDAKQAAKQDKSD